MRIRTCIVVCFCILIIGFSAGLAVGIPTGAKPVREELDGVRQALESAGERSANLEQRLGQAESLARSSAERVELALGEAGRIKDAGKRIVYLVGEIRTIVGVLREISGSGTSAP